MGLMQVSEDATKLKFFLPRMFTFFLFDPNPDDADDATKLKCFLSRIFTFLFFDPNPQHHDAVTGTEKQNVAEDYRLNPLLVYWYHNSNVSCILEMKFINIDFSPRAC